MEKHMIRVDMWKVSRWTLNEYYGSVQRSMLECATRSPNQEWMIKKKLSKEDIKQKKKPYDVARFSVGVSLEEVFAFHLTFDNWTFKSAEEHALAKIWDAKRKKLIFVIPTGRHSQATTNIRCTKKRTYWNELPGKFLWLTFLNISPLCVFRFFLWFSHPYLLWKLPQQ